MIMMIMTKSQLFFRRRQQQQQQQHQEQYQNQKMTRIIHLFHLSPFHHATRLMLVLFLVFSSLGFQDHHHHDDSFSIFRRVPVVKAFQTIVVRHDHLVITNTIQQQRIHQHQQYDQRISTPSTTTTIRNFRHSQQSLMKMMNMKKNGGQQLQDFLDQFLQQRSNDFIPLQQSKNLFGPGPIVVTMNIPTLLETNELYDMIEDTITSRSSSSSKYKIYRIHYYNPKEYDSSIDTTDNSPQQQDISCPELDLSVQDFMTKIMNNELSQQQVIEDEIQKIPNPPILTTLSIDKNKMKMNPSSNHNNNNNFQLPMVLLFSGYDHDDMMRLYEVIGNELYLEWEQQQQSSDNDTEMMNKNKKFIPPACAKVVPKSMDKSMRQVIYEICGDHQDATTK